MATPQLPLELITDLIELAVELLVEEERHLPSHEPLSNRFLRSATLVDRTWNAIATPILLKNGIVTSGSVAGFIGQVKAHGMEMSLGSVRFGKASGGVTAEDAAKEDTAFNLLVETLPGLNSVELLESGSHFKTALPPGRTIQKVHLSNYDMSSGGFVCKFGRSPPSHLASTDTRERCSNNTLAPFLGVLKSVRTITISANHFQGLSPIYYLHSISLIGDPARGSPLLETCHFECTSLGAYQQLLYILRQKYDTGRQMALSYPHLERLTIHLLPADFLLALGSQPRLTTLEILPDPPGLVISDFISDKDPNIILQQLLQALPVLEKLEVPASWASDALKDACEAKGVVLLSK